MKTFLLATIAAVLCATSAVAAPKPRPVETAAVTDTDWVFSAEGMAMWRGGFARNPVLLDIAGGGRAIYDSSVVEPDNAAPGFRAYLERNIGGGRSFELGGFATATASRSALFISPGETLYAPYDSTFNPANPLFFNSQAAYAATYGYSTQIMGVEANYKMPFYALGQNVKILAGVRWIRLKDKFNSIFYDELNDFQGTDTDIDRTSIQVTNNLFGVQVGLQGMAPIGSGFSIGGRGTFGLYANAQQRKFDFSADNGAGPIGAAVSITSNNTQFAQVVELLPRVEYAFARNWVAFVSGQYLMLHGVGDVTSGYGDFGRIPGGTLTTNNTAHFYGVSGGLKASFTP